jgi:ChrR Cupin-like domain
MTDDITQAGPLKIVTQIEKVEPAEVAPGIVRRRLTATDHARGWLTDFAPGTPWPEVDIHEGEERYLVLDGEILDGDEQHGPGTYVTFLRGSRHRPRTETGARVIGISLLTG